MADDGSDGVTRLHPSWHRWLRLRLRAIEGSAARDVFCETAIAGPPLSPPAFVAAVIPLPRPLGPPSDRPLKGHGNPRFLRLTIPIDDGGEACARIAGLLLRAAEELATDNPLRCHKVRGWFRKLGTLRTG